MRAPLILGDTAVLRALLADAGIVQVHIRTVEGTARFPSLECWVHTDVKGWTLADKIDEAQYQTLLRESGPALQCYVKPDGSVCFAAPAHIVTATKP
jgi:hypothetical protein